MSFSLLWPTDQRPFLPLPDTTFVDLRVDALVAALVRDHRERRFADGVIRQLIRDPNVLNYRLDTLSNLVADKALSDKLTDVLPTLNQLASQNNLRLPVDRKRSGLFDVVERISELELYVDCVQGFQLALTSLSVASAGLKRLQTLVDDISADSQFQQLVAELPELRATMQQAASVTIGVNLDHNLRPIAATLLEVHAEPFSSGSFLDRLLGRQRLHTMPDIDEQAIIKLTGKREVSPMMVPLFADLAQVLDQVTGPVAATLKKYSQLNAGVLINLRDELRYLLSAANLVHRLQARGLTMIRPKILPPNERRTVLKDNYNVLLALDVSKTIVANDVPFDSTKRIFVLTGPNGGGKTTYLQAVGLTQLMAQVGLFVPATSAEISPVDHLLTHFQSAEKFELGTGRFGEEATRLRRIFDHITDQSMVLLNEPLVSTGAGESYYLARDIVRLFRQIGIRCIFATHLHELAANVDALNRNGNKDVISIVASPIRDDANERTFRVIERPPLGQSYARELAARYGVSFEQLSAAVQRRLP